MPMSSVQNRSHGRDAHPLVGRMRALDLRADREHVQVPADLGADHGGLEAGVDRAHDRRLAEQPLGDRRATASTGESRSGRQPL